MTAVVFKRYRSYARSKCDYCFPRDRVAGWRVEVLGWPAGFCCDRHRKEWVAMWDRRGLELEPELVAA